MPRTPGEPASVCAPDEGKTDARSGRGIAIAARLFAEVVAPIVDAALPGVPYGAALLGNGSEVLGFDDEISTDHGFGPHLQVFLPAGHDGDDRLVAALDRGLPETFAGLAIRYPARDGQRDEHHVDVTTVARFCRAALGFDPLAGMRAAHWLATPTQRLATVTAGAVFADGTGELAAVRDTLRWYPDDVWRYALAAQWLRVAQMEAFVGRAGSTGDDLGSTIVGAGIVRDYMRLAFLVERQWAPYPKWFGRGFSLLRSANALTPMFERALRAARWRDREAALCDAGEYLLAATNALELATPLAPERRQFYERDFRVMGADRVVIALTDAITDPEVRACVDAAGRRDGVPALAGTVDQFVDSTDVLENPARCTAVTAALPTPGL
jgi:Domain of unknown function (DUF4037)